MTDVYVAELRLRNWGPFRGEHVLALEPKAYAVLARLADDPTRSNFLGKTHLVSAVDFALYGRHGAEAEDGWITRGQDDGEVSLTLSTGERILRKGSRKKPRGKASFFPVGGAEAKGDEAQLAVERAVGLSARDFAATCFFRQKAMSQLVTMQPGDRMRIVAEWLRLGPLERCAEVVAGRLSALLDEQAAAERDAHAQAAVVDSQLGGASFEVLSADIDLLEVAVERLDVLGRGLDAERDAFRERESLRQESERFDRLRAEGLAITEKLAGYPAALDGEREAAKAVHFSARVAHDEAARRCAERQALLGGKFDGRCPVLPGFECPAKREIAGRQAEHAAGYEEARARFQETSALLGAANAEVCRLSDLARERDSLARQREVITEQMKPLVDARKKLRALPEVDGDGLDARVSAHRLEEIAAHEARARARAALKAGVEAAKKRDEALKRGAEVARRAATLREALVVFGKQGAQRAVAEESLAEIEGLANEMLAEAGVPLTVRVRWSREGSGAASSCDACGHPFGRSLKEKECARCGAARGANVVSRLDVLVSDRSGAAEDLAGVALQLAASEWLRADRSAAWGTVVLDEPFSACDPAMRRSMTLLLRGLLGRSCAQALVISHDAQTSGSFSGRIVIESTVEHVDGRDTVVARIAEVV